MKKHIPNIITAGNAFMGTLAIVYVFENKPNAVIICIVIALLFDFMDGLVARALNVSSEIGKQLDSLADMVTFGVLPGIMMYQVLLTITCSPDNCGPSYLNNQYVPLIGFVITVLSAFRLAKFNVSTDQQTNFKGIPTPITALFIAGVYYNSFEPSGLLSFLYCPSRLIVITLIASTLLVSEDLFIAFKFKKGATYREKIPEVLLALISVILIAVTKEQCAVYIYITYIITSYLKFKFLTIKKT